MLSYGMTEEELVLENLSMDLLEQGGLRPRKILDDLIWLERGPAGAMSRVATMAMKLFEKIRREAAEGDVRLVRYAVNEDQLLLACLHTALIWECG